jgi:hypothetical protein
MSPVRELIFEGGNIHVVRAYSTGQLSGKYRAPGKQILQQVSYLWPVCRDDRYYWLFSSKKRVEYLVNIGNHSGGPQSSLVANDIQTNLKVEYTLFVFVRKYTALPSVLLALQYSEWTQLQDVEMKRRNCLLMQALSTATRLCSALLRTNGQFPAFNCHRDEL